MIHYTSNKHLVAPGFSWGVTLVVSEQFIPRGLGMD